METKVYYKNLFLRKIYPTTRGSGFSQSGKGIRNPKQYCAKKQLPLFVENYYSDPQYEFGDRTEKAGKISQQMGLITRFLNSRNLF